MKEFQGDLQVFFSDLNEEAQKEVLEFYGLTDPCEANFDVVPIMILEKEDSDFSKADALHDAFKEV